MSRIFNRPMFKRGGSAGQGITSGLNRPGYALGDSVDIEEVIRLKEKMKPLYGRPPQGYGVYDFLTDWGLRMASAPPSGNVLQTGAKQAIEPHERLMAGKGEAEMAEYLSDVKATDQALGAVTDIAVARAKNTLNKDFSVKRRVDTLSTQIRDKANPGTFASTIQGSMGLALGQVYVTDLIQEQGANVNVGIIANENEEGDFSFDAGNLDMDKIWWDPKKQSWLVVTESINDDGETVAKKNYYTTFDEADKFHTQKKTVDSIDEESVVGDKKIKEKEVDWDTQIELEKFEEQPKFTEEYLRNKFDRYVEKIRKIVDFVPSDIEIGMQVAPPISAEDRVFWSNYQKDPEKAYQRWKNKITNWAKKQKKQKDFSEKIGADVDYGIKKADGGLMRNIRNIDEESANELQRWWDSQRFAN